MTWLIYCMPTWPGMTSQPPSASLAFIVISHYFNGSAVSSTCVLVPMLTEFWCTLILQIVKATSHHASTADKLQDIINLTKDIAISSYFIGALQYLLTLDKLSPFGIEAYSWVRTGDDLLWPHTCYLETKFLWNKVGSDGISAEGHIAIIKYYMFVLLASVVDRYFPLILIFKISSNNRTCRKFSDKNRNLPVKQTGEVHWNCHLLNTPASSSILQYLLTFHYIFTRRTDLICVTASEALGWLSLSFLKASLAWFRVNLDLSLWINSVLIEISDSSGVIIIESRTVIWHMFTILTITMKNIKTKTTEAKALKHGASTSLPRRKIPPYSFPLLHLQTLPIGHLQITTTSPGPQTTIWTQTNSSSRLPKLALFVVSVFYFGWDVCWACEEGGNISGANTCGGNAELSCDSRCKWSLPGPHWVPNLFACCAVARLFELCSRWYYPFLYSRVGLLIVLPTEVLLLLIPFNTFFPNRNEGDKIKFSSTSILCTWAWRPEWPTPRFGIPTQKLEKQKSARRTASEHRSSTGRESANILGMVYIVQRYRVQSNRRSRDVNAVTHTHDEILELQNSCLLMGCPIVPLHPYVFTSFSYPTQP